MPRCAVSNGTVGKSETVSQNTAQALKRGLTEAHGIAFKTGVALAEYDDEIDEKGNILVTDKHFKDCGGSFKGFQRLFGWLAQGQ